MRLYTNTVADYFFTVSHVRIFEVATKSGWRTDIVRRVGVDQTDRTGDSRIVRQLLNLFDLPFAVQEADVSFMLTGADAQVFGCHNGYPPRETASGIAATSCPPSTSLNMLSLFLDAVTH